MPGPQGPVAIDPSSALATSLVPGPVAVGPGPLTLLVDLTETDAGVDFLIPTALPQSAPVESEDLPDTLPDEYSEAETVPGDPSFPDTLPNNSDEAPVPAIESQNFPDTLPDNSDHAPMDAPAIQSQASANPTPSTEILFIHPQQGPVPVVQYWQTGPVSYTHLTLPTKA